MGYGQEDKSSLQLASVISAWVENSHTAKAYSLMVHSSVCVAWTSVGISHRSFMLKQAELL